MPTFLLIDLAILLILAIFIGLGVRKGFVLSLCSFLAIFVAFFGAAFLAKTLAPTFADLASPHASPAIVETLGNSTSTTDPANLSQEETKVLLTDAGYPEGWAGMIQTLYTPQIGQSSISPLEILADYVLELIVYGIIFIVSFILLLVVWFIFSRTLNLVTKLPVLNFCNRSLGAVFGALQGLLVLMLLFWALFDLTETLPMHLASQSYLIQWSSLLLENTFLGNALL